jgi:DNA-binding MarR family transcriptional regulator
MRKSKQELVSEFLTLMPKFRQVIDSSFIVEDKIGTLLQLTALESIEANSPIVVGELSQSIGLSASSTSQLTDRLFDAGYIKRESDSNDRRIVKLELTEGGKKRLRGLREIVKKTVGVKISLFPEGDLRELIRIITNFVNISDKLS